MLGSGISVGSTAIQASGLPSGFVPSPTTVRLDAESAVAVHGYFCPKCGVRLLHRRTADVVNIKAGTLDDTTWLRPVGHLWTKSRQPWVAIPNDILVYPDQPQNYDALIEARQRQAGNRD